MIILLLGISVYKYIKYFIKCSFNTNIFLIVMQKLHPKIPRLRKID